MLYAYQAEFRWYDDRETATSNFFPEEAAPGKTRLTAAEAWAFAGHLLERRKPYLVEVVMVTEITYTELPKPEGHPSCLSEPSSSV